MRDMPYAIRKLRFRAMHTKLRAPVAWWRHRGLHPSDVFLASFERSGSHLLRFLLHEILTGRPADFDTIKQTLPWITSGFRKASRILPGGGRLISTHEQYRREYRKAIYLVRDIRDVLLSNYLREKYALGTLSYYNIADLDAYLKLFLLTKRTRYGPWQDHVRSWLDSPLAKSGDLLVIRFEDMRRNTQDTLIQVLDFLGVRVDRKGIRAAIENNSLEKMRAKEDVSQTLPHKEGEDSRFVRKGYVGGWREHLTDAQVGLIQQYAGSVLARIGYPGGGSPTNGANWELATQLRS